MMAPIVPPAVAQLLQMKRASQGSAEAGPTVGLQSHLTASQGRGAPLPPEVRARLEPRFGVDLGEVSIHTDGSSARLNRALGAHAFAYGRDIYFGSGQYDPSSTRGQWLLAHELTHVVQQTRGARARGAQGSLVMGRSGDAYEREADRVADAVTAGAPASGGTRLSRGSAAAAPVGVGLSWALGSRQVQPKSEAGAGEGAAHAMMESPASSLVLLSAPESIQGHLFGGDCVAAYWNLAAAITALLAAAAVGIGLILAPDPTTVTKWVAAGTLIGVLSGIAWTINAIVSLIDCKAALNRPDDREEIERLRRRLEQLERAQREIQRMSGQSPAPSASPAPAPPVAPTPPPSAAPAPRPSP
ncbi:DUF4157 domain-containing protein [Sorangium sp. So ce1182]|uniref:DUF4157 domain-containing protein n=1 Tax=Sorangium sp. So ce1182 TaxID=3133334 RepID=UPI003F61D261